MATGKYKEWLEKDKLILLEGWRRDGLSYAQIAANIGISEGTLNNWCLQHREIREALKKGEEVCVYEVENALYKAAIGYDVVETEQIETQMPNGTTSTQKRAKKRHSVSKSTSRLLSKVILTIPNSFLLESALRD